jgi:DNA repair protein RadC
MVGSDLISLVARDRKELECTARPSSTYALYVRDGSDFREADDQDVVIRAQELVARRFRQGLPVLANSRALRSFLQLHMAPLQQMRLAALFLNRRKRLLAYRELFVGTIDEIEVHPREVVRDALACNAVSVILVRNEPSGDVIFSRADATTWRRVSEALALVDIATLDYMLVGARVVSYAEKKWIAAAEPSEGVKKRVF